MQHLTANRNVFRDLQDAFHRELGLLLVNCIKERAVLIEGDDDAARLETRAKHVDRVGIRLGEQQTQNLRLCNTQHVFARL